MTPFVVVGVALIAPSPAQAHLRTSRAAVDYEAAVSAKPSGVDVRIYRADLALRVTVLDHHRVLVLGYLGEPFLRIGPAGAFVNASSLTAVGSGLATRGTHWRLYSRRPTVTWHDTRLRTTGRWTVPLIVDGQHASLVGETRRVGRPPVWPWALVGVFFAFTTALAFARRESLRLATTVLGTLAAAAALATAIGFAVTSTASAGAWIEGANETVFILVGAAFLVWGSADARALAGGCLGLVAVAVGVTKLPVLTHGIVLSALPGQAARLAVAFAIAAGAAAAILGVVVFFDVLEHYEEPPELQQYL